VRGMNKLFGSEACIVWIIVWIIMVREDAKFIGNGAGDINNGADTFLNRINHGADTFLNQKITGQILFSAKNHRAVTFVKQKNH
jgi:hypothetical protein